MAGTGPAPATHLGVRGFACPMALPRTVLPRPSSVGTRPVALLLMVAFTACTGREAGAADIPAVLERHTEELMALPGVVGVGQGSCDGTPCILVLVSQTTPALEEHVPSQLEGIPVTIRVTGEIIAEPGE